MIPTINEEIMRSKCNFFVSTQLWPLRNKLDPDGWLANFELSDKKMALQLLNSFMYFSDDLLDRMFVSAVQGLSRIVTTSHKSLSDRRVEWWQFLEDSIFTFPTGENPFAGDSGHLFVRRARDLLQLDEEKILDPKNALAELCNGATKNIIFVDDFVGTGQQFFKTWNRLYSVGSRSISFENLSSTYSFRAFYCPIFCTKYAIENQLNQLKDKVTFAPSHWLTQEHNLFSDDSIWWPNSMKSDAYDFVRNYSMQIGLPDTGGYDTRDWQAFHKLGLAISFRHCCPDATIPLFDTTEGGWCPLWKR
ncbi:hypothetical protein [uncultured Gimesia sp.]|uniref:phosphoribosyltransferase-like protein n=1 Tax=uncultured Gimesia sp. TaxID=1678688 RepID=UPI0030D9093D|tara:strand:+ start:64770 stop:65684 length:915 start_codon:yes stop_codon:yes gene_type:complete